jgi:hypothetical protein
MSVKVFRKDKEKEDIKQISNSIKETCNKIEAQKIETELAKHWFDIFGKQMEKA